MSNSGEGSKKKTKNPEEIINGFQKLRSEQRFLTHKLAEMETELHEHKIVIEALKDLDGSRKCFRMIGGVLCERTVGDILPVLVANSEQLEKVVESFNKQLIAKGIEINAYKEEHNVKVKGADDSTEAPESENKTPVGGVLVS